MTMTNRAIFALAASVLTIGLAAAPSAYAADAMKDGMHKAMKKHKGAMKHDAMHDAMHKDAAPKDVEPVQ